MYNSLKTRSGHISYIRLKNSLSRKKYFVRIFIIALFFAAFSPIFAQETTPDLKTDESSALIDTAMINAMKDSINWRLNQFFDIEMLDKCLQVRKIGNVKGITLLKKNKPLMDTINLFENGYGTNIFVNSFINSSQLWPRLLFNKDKITDIIANPKNTPAIGFDIRFTPKGTGVNRVFNIDILNKSTGGLLDNTKQNLLLQATNTGLVGNAFAQVSSEGKDSVNQAMFRGIATLRRMMEEQTKQCNIAQVTFEPCSGQQYGFDVLPHDAIKQYYEQLPINGRQYEVPWKSVGTNGSDSVRVKVVLRDKNAPTHKVNFRSANPTFKISPKGADTYSISFSGGADKNEQTVEAFYTDTLPNGKVKEHIIGKLKIRSYAPIAKKLTPVILNGASFSINANELAKTLNSIYKQSAVTWTVNPSISINADVKVWDKDNDRKLLIETSPFGRYSNEMQAIIDAIGKTPDPETYYVIITDLPNNYNYAGYMPLKSQFAFLFINNFSSNAEGGGAPAGDNTGYHIIAHELGHGAFYMKHIENEYKILDATNNLMDGFSMGKTLWKPQWDWIGDPSWRLYMFQKESDGASIAESYKDKIDYDKLIKWLRDNKGKTVDYKFKEFVSKEFLTVYTTISAVTIHIDKQYSETIDGKTFTLTLKGELSTKDGTVTLIDKNSNIPLEINFDKDNIVFYDNVYFDKLQNTSTQEFAISLTTNKVEDFERLMAIQGYTYGDKAKEYYLNKFQNAFKLASNDRNKIDFLWENIPDIVAQALPDKQKWENMISISEGWVDIVGNNEEKAVVKIVKSISPSYLQQKVDNSYTNSELLASIFIRLSNDYRSQFIQSITIVFNNGWENSEPKSIYIEETRIPDDYRWGISNGAHTSTNAYKFGHCYFCKDPKTDWNYDCSKISTKDPIFVFENFGEEFNVTASSPIITTINNQEIVLPAVLVLPLLKERNSDYSNKFLSLSVGYILPSALLKPATLAKWSKFFKKGDAVAGEVAQGAGIDVAQAELRYAKTYVSSTTKPFGLQIRLEEVERIYGANGKKIVQATENRAKEIIAETGGNIQGDPVLTGLVDNKTGQVFYGRNLSDPTEIKQFVENLHPILKKRLELHNTHITDGTLKAAATDIQRAGLPSSHSEISAIDQALKARGTAASEADLTDFIIHNRKLGGQVDILGVPKGCPPRCTHCWFLSDGIKVIGND